MKPTYKAWLEQQPNLAPKTITNQIGHVGAVERAYGDLDELYDQGGLSAVIDQLRYSSADKLQPQCQGYRENDTGSLVALLFDSPRVSGYRPRIELTPTSPLPRALEAPRSELLAGSGGCPGGFP